MKKIAILGSTGSIGKQTLNVVEHLGERVKVTALAAGSDWEQLEQQAKKWQPKCVALFNEEGARELKSRLPGIEVLSGMEGLEAVASLVDLDLVVSAITGTMGIRPTVAAILAGHDVALANKEALVSAGELITRLVKERGVNLLPIDSEHSALFQCLVGEDLETVQRLILTASGGPFRKYSEEQLQTISVKEALNHPTWKMGAKVTVDCSTLMNKGLEMIEARWLFDLPSEKVDVIVHPESLIHSMVEFVDGSLKAQISETTMELPIQYALTYPKRLKGTLPPFDFAKYGCLNFFEPKGERFRCLQLAQDALKEGKSVPGFMNAANEVLVHRFLNQEIKWIEIGQKLERLMEGHKFQDVSSLENVLFVDQQARDQACVI